ncbi:hypothetical protein VQL36_19365 [Chengkuizengella sp. SCS-71B]|uniref:hypothetical protein n=1 Tax=Chengkuizengella sp. SCS-71B TaxID=3115290 RepID=UPI0032C24052
MYVKPRTEVEQINFLASQKYTSFTYQISDVGVTPNEEGKKIVPAGTIYPSNDANAIGILFNDTDVTEGPQPGALLVEAWLLEDRLPTAPTAEAKTAMNKISFKKFV